MAVVWLTLLVLKSDMFPASWPLDKAVKVCLWNPWVLIADQQLCFHLLDIPVLRDSGICTVWQCRLSPINSNIASWDLHPHRSHLGYYISRRRLHVFPLNITSHFVDYMYHHIMQLYLVIITLNLFLCVCGCVPVSVCGHVCSKGCRPVLIMDKGGGETSSNLLPVSAVSNLASSNGWLANGRAIPMGQ